MVIRAFAENHPVPPISGDTGLVACPIWFSPGASVRLTPENYSSFFSGQNVVADKNFKENMAILGHLYPDFARDFQLANPSSSITFAPCLHEHWGHLFIFDNSRIKIPAGPVRVYGEFVNTNNCKIFQIEKVEPLQ